MIVSPSPITDTGLTPTSWRDRGAILYFARQYDRAIEQFRAVLDMEPKLSRAHLIVGAYVEKGRFADALAHIETWRRIEDGPWVWKAELQIYRRSGQLVKARQALAKLERWNRQSRLDAAPIFAAAYIGMNQDEAIAWLQKAYEEHSSVLSAAVPQCLTAPRPLLAFLSIG